MTRRNAREIAVHFIFELSFSNDRADSPLEEFDAAAYCDGLFAAL